MTDQPAPISKKVFSPLAAAVVVFAGVLAFCVFFIGSAFDTGAREDLDGGAHPLSKSAIGYSGAVDFLRRLGRPVIVARGQLPSEAAGKAVLILTIDDGDPSTNLNGLPSRRGFDGPVLVVMPKWRVSGHPNHRGWVYKEGLRNIPVDRWVGPTRRGPKIKLSRHEGRFTHKLTQAEDGAPGLTQVTGGIDNFQTMTPSEGWKPVLRDESGRTVMMVFGDTQFYVLSEPDLLNNQGLKDLANAKALLFALDQMPRAGGAVVFDVTLHGFERPRSVLQSLFRPPFVAATLCLMAAALLMVWHAFFRFGRERVEGRAFALGKRALADNQAALIKMARREHRLGGRYGAIVRDLAARAVGAPHNLSPEALDAFLDRLGSGGRTSWPLSQLRGDAERAKDSAELVKAAAQLHHWKLEMTRERR